MKFKKISAIITSVLMAGATVGFAAAANYPAPFVDDGVANVAIVYGTGAGVSSLDMVQAGNIQTSLGNAMPSTGGVSVTGDESFKLEKSSNFFNFNESLNDIYSSLDKDQMDFLADGNYNDGDIDEDYEQSITMGAGALTLFADSDYEDSEPTIGFKFVNDELILSYTIDFDTPIALGDMNQTDMPLMGGSYYVLNADTSQIDILDTAESHMLAEGDETTLTLDDVDYTVSVAVYSDGNAKFTVNGEGSEKIAEGEYDEVLTDVYVVAKEVNYNAKEVGISDVEFALGKGKLELYQDGSEVDLNDENVDGLTAAYTLSTTNLDKLTLSWYSHKDMFLTESNSLTMPAFEKISMAFGGLSFDSDEEEIVFSSGDTLLLEMDNFDIPLMNSESSAIYLGEDGNYLVTAVSTAVNYSNLTTAFTGYIADNDTLPAGGLHLEEGDRFIVTILADANSDIEQEYYEVTSIDYTNEGNAELELEDLIGDNDLSFDQVEDKERGEFNFDILGMNETSVYLNFTAGTDTVTFNKIVSDKGAIITVPALARAATATIESNVFTFTEADEDEDLNQGVLFSIDVTNSSNDRLYASILSEANVTIEETLTNDEYIGYVESVVASKIMTDESGDEYELSIEYTGKEAIADVNVVAGSIETTPGVNPLGDVVVMDSEIATVSSKNLIIVGGSCINSAAATVLGGAYCGPAFTQATGVGTGQFLIKGVQDAYTTGKLALVVAGYEAADTTNAGTYLTMKDVDTSKEYIGTSATEATLQVA